MKIISKLTFLALGLGLLFTACKKPAGEKAVTGAAQDISKTTAGEAYMVNPGTSKMIWTASKPGTTHTGTVNISSGSLQAQNGAVTSGNFTMDMNTITNNDLEGGMKASLESHLKGMTDEKADDFFNVRKYPTVSFNITKVEPTSTTPDANYNVTGNLKIKEIEKSITFPASIVVVGDKISAVSPSFKINRTEWGLNFMSKSVFDNLKDKFIDDEIALNLQLEASKK